jgi:hypothetical protein
VTTLAAFGARLGDPVQLGVDAPVSVCTGAKVFEAELFQSTNLWISGSRMFWQTTWYGQRPSCGMVPRTLITGRNWQMNAEIIAPTRDNAGRFPPGVSGNPGGRPPGLPLTSASAFRAAARASPSWSQPTMPAPQDLRRLVLVNRGVLGHCGSGNRRAIQ